MKMYDGTKKVLYGPLFHPQDEGESNDGSTMTEQVYIPLRDQIEEMLLSGRMLDAYRKELYHFGADEEVDEDFEDPTLHPSYDAAQASIDRARLLGKRDRLVREAELRRKLEEEQQLELPLEGVPGPAVPEKKVVKRPGKGAADAALPQEGA
jgi:hypothetical protein